jgi:zinc protease
MNACGFFLGLVIAAAPLASQQPPGGPPPPGAVTAFPLPTPQESVLPNGLRVVVLERHRQPVVSIVLSLPAGTSFDPEGKEGLADMLAAMMTRGAGKRSAAEVAAAIESSGGSLSAAADPDYLTMQADVLTPHLALAFELIADAVLRPQLEPAEIQSLRDRTAASLEAGAGDVAALAERVFLLALYRQHPYARRPSPRSVRAIGRADLLAFLHARFRPAGSTLLLSGDITLADARRLATATLGTWKGQRPPPLPAPTAPSGKPGIVLVHAGGVKDAAIIVGGMTFPAGDTSYYAATVLTQLLGDARLGRLPRVLGSDHRWASEASAGLLRTTGRGFLQSTATVPAESADSALREVYTQLARVRTDLVPTAELGRVRENLAGTYALNLQTAGQLATALMDARQLGLPPAYLVGYRSRILAVTAMQVRAVARRVLPQNGLVTVVVGDAARLYQPLSQLDSVRLFASDGRPLTPQAIAPRQAAFTIHGAGGRVPGTDSLVVLAEGKAVGLQVTSVTASGDSLTYVEETALGTTLSQTTRVVFDTTGVMRRVDQSGKVQGQETRIQLTYQEGRVRGSAMLATTAGPRQLTIDTAASAAVVDDNAIQALLPYLHYELNTRWALQVFASGEGRIRPMTLTVADLSRISVPAGEFDCYRVDLEGGPQRLSYYVTSGMPRRVVRIEIAHSPIEFVAVNP